ncbi:MAG: hypothetical protein NZ954_02600 [Thermofilaceae archaeon]|nr:hypothetical protein [Thermofilaceae archaeon]MDW8004766.1 hypothetical protein [Thermofilaceae archaeon]
MQDLLQAIIDNLIVVIQEYIVALTHILPRALGMIMILVFGWFLGRVLGKATAAIVKLSKAEDALKNTPIGAYMVKAGYSLSTFMDLIARIVVYLFSIALAIRVFNIPEAIELAQNIFDVVERIVLGTVMAVIGLLIVEKLVEIASRVLDSGDKAGTLTLNIVHGILILLVVAAALSAAGIDLTSFTVLLASLVQGLGFGIGLSLVVIVIALFREDILKFMHAFQEMKAAREQE